MLSAKRILIIEDDDTTMMDQDADSTVPRDFGECDSTQQLFRSSIQSGIPNTLNHHENTTSFQLNLSLSYHSGYTNTPKPCSKVTAPTPRFPPALPDSKARSAADKIAQLRHLPASVVHSGLASMEATPGSVGTPIELDEDDDENRSLPATLSKSSARSSSGHSSSILGVSKYKLLIDLDGDEDIDPGRVGNTFKKRRATHRAINWQLHDSGRHVEKSLEYEIRNPPIVGPWTSLDKYYHNGFNLRPGKTVELTNGDFLRISHIIRNATTEKVRLRGNRLQRTRDLNGMLEMKLNEICLCYEIDLDDPRPPQEQSAIEISIDQIVKLRNVRFTNQSFPNGRNITVSDYENQDKAAAEGGLTVRWKLTCTYASSADREGNIYKERSLEYVTAGESAGHYAVSDAARRFEWRGETVLGGGYRPWSGKDETVKLPREDATGSTSSGSSSAKGKRNPEQCGIPRHQIDSAASYALSFGKRKQSLDEIRQSHTLKRPRTIDGKSMDNATRSRTSLFQTDYFSSTVSPCLSIIPYSSPLSTPPPTGSLISTSPPSTPQIRRSPGQKLTYGDAFCGAGGATRGAHQAGLYVAWGFDISPIACTTWRANFPHATSYNLHSSSFTTISPAPQKVDILHLSPPCQFFSLAHSRAGPDDEMNTASLFGVQAVIEVARPRIATLEQTFGICRAGFRGYFNALVQMFTARGFSVRWAVVGLSQWGLPQRRNRLIMIASCPGEHLPAMPPATHGHGPNLLPLVTITDTFSSLPFDASTSTVRFQPEKFKPPYDGNKIMPRAMTTCGGNWHPSGERGFTINEYAALQGFPRDHVFEGSYRKKQIGNAVPPVVARVLFESIRRELDSVDGVVGEREVVEIH